MLPPAHNEQLSDIPPGDLPDGLNDPPSPLQCSDDSTEGGDTEEDIEEDILPTFGPNCPWTTTMK